MPKDPSKKSKKRPAEEESEEDVGVGEMPAVDEEAAQQAASRKQKKKKMKPEPEPEPELEPEPESEDDDEEDDGSAEQKARQKRSRKRLAKRVSGYRAKAAECGFKPGAGVIAAAGVDSFASALTAADAKRLMRFVPENLGKSSYEKSECAARMKLSTESVPVSAARETQARCEAVLRKVMNQAVLRTLEKGVMRVDAATMQSVLRPYQYNMNFTAVLPPKGLVRHAQGQGALTANASDEAALDQEKADNKELAAAAKKIDADYLKRKEAFAVRRKELAAERAAKAVA